MPGQVVLKVQWSFAKARGSLGMGQELSTERGRENLLATGAKLKYQGGGRWMIYGYAYDGRDVKPYLP